MLYLVNNFKLKVTTVQILNQIKLTIVEQYDFEVIYHPPYFSLPCTHVCIHNMLHFLNLSCIMK